MLILYMITAFLVGVSFLAAPRKTGRALDVALRRFLRILPTFVVVMVLVAVVLHLVPDHLVMRVLARESKWAAMVSAIGFGSVSVIPGFIAFPLCGLLRDRGALYMVISAFSTTLMMVGVVTFPMEKVYLGARLAFWRNATALVIAIVVAVATGFVFGELP
ncbi:MAG: hypothetical protein HN742_21430 [Lentisphaerae bacterium]|jgi:uncharacterized membrane protein YraQ (UPF0718 family)|nr:hypothetical protein [Lentisphaerota bacterium]MBT4815119.1 hypothetical protein [Lentisphaerota bacterium]MBT5613104.1 hypothetical protein [Lentisphaerota bacterium]MBT7056424.1 hypothetical protein [Lentisphaerota bacterium]MBT7844453.1 hypothetical protein [Lentisphaerota bacterium]